MIKVIKDFFPKPVFDYMKLLVESEKGMLWNFNPTNLQPGDRTPGAENHKLGKTLYVHPSLSGDGKDGTVQVKGRMSARQRSLTDGPAAGGAAVHASCGLRRTNADKLPGAAAGQQRRRSATAPPRKRRA